MSPPSHCLKPSSTGSCLVLFFFFFFNDTATTEIYTLSLHDALPICSGRCSSAASATKRRWCCSSRSEEHTSELQSRRDLVCRLLLEKKKQKHRHRAYRLSQGTVEKRVGDAHRC